MDVRGLEENMSGSKMLKEVQLVGFKFSKEGFAMLGRGVAKARKLKRLIIN